jgi:ribonucleoside-diphosphate reductase alpha chain
MASSAPAAPPSPVVAKRDGSTAPFDSERIRAALEKAFQAAYGPHDAEHVQRVQALTDEVAARVARSSGKQVHVEHIQNEVEAALRRAGEAAVARRYARYRQERAQERQARQSLAYVTAGGEEQPIDFDDLRERIEAACGDLPDETLFERATAGFYDGMAQEEIDRALVMAAKSLIEEEPGYSYVAARLLLGTLYEEATGERVSAEEREAACRSRLHAYLEDGVERELLAPALLERFDLEQLAEALRPARNIGFTYLSLQTLYDRYLIKTKGGRRIELPQHLWMRVAMGLALNEDDPTRRAIQFYDVLSTRRFVNSTPTLFNSGTLHPQLSSCYLTTIGDDLGQIFKCIRDNALLSKWAGGIGNDWTRVRAMGSFIEGTGGRSQGVVPFLKIANDTAVAVNQGGKRKGAKCAYLETWHLDVEEFLELRKNTGDERRRTHDMNTAHWVPDLFMKRVREEGSWTLFSPDEVGDLHDLYGAAFEERYREYEAQAARGEIEKHKEVDAVTLWRKMLSMLFETGHPWITFKDAANVRSPQDHAGVVHSSNLCTEITLNTSDDETAVCNLGSVNLPAHMTDGVLDHEALDDTLAVAMRMLDNVVDLNFYPTEEAERSNKRHRPIGLGVMGFQDALHEARLSYDSEEAAAFADRAQEAVSYFALKHSARLAEARGAYPSFEGSKWDRGLLPLDTLDLLEKERGVPVAVNRAATMDWGVVRNLIATHGLRNSNTMAIAPTATISNISGVSQSIKPAYKHLYAKSNLSGEFTVVNEYLVRDLKERGLWDEDMIDDLKYYDGSVQPIDRVPDDLKALYPTAFEIHPHALIACAARRQKWIDQAQSLNLYLDEPSGKRLHAMYMAAWEQGLKTTYYLRSQGATQVEKSTVDVNKRGLQPRWMKSRSASADVEVERGDGAPGSDAAPPAGSPSSDLPSCDIEDDDCEACQ